MSTQQIITSAALYFEAEQDQSIPVCWLERARELFAEYDLSPILFTANGGDFLHDDCYVLAERGGDLVKFGEVLTARREDLVDALRRGIIQYLSLDSPRPGADYRSDWRAAVFVSSASSPFYVGIDEHLSPDASVLLKRALGIAKGLFDVRYGIAYKSSLADFPDGYAGGSVSTSLSNVLEMIRHRKEWARRKKNPVELWGEELSGQKRHLTGLFRGAYPASILSEAHVRNADLRSLGIGRLSELDASLWLWELTDAELPAAEAMLESRRLLVHQMDTVE